MHFKSQTNLLNQIFTMKNPLQLLLTYTLIPVLILSCKQKPQEQTTTNFKMDSTAQLFNEYFSKIEHFNGNVLVAKSGQVRFVKSYGFSNAELNVPNKLDSKFRIGSITKQFTAMAIMLLHESGELNFSDKITNYLKGTPKSWSEITIHQLLTHTAGFKNSWMMDGFVQYMALNQTSDQVIDKYMIEPLLFEPGTDCNYSGYGYYLLTKIVEEVSGKTFELFLQNEIFEPLGMNNSGCDHPERIIENRAQGYEMRDSLMINAPHIHMPILTGGANLYSTVNDLLLWDQSLTNNKLISQEAKERMFTVEKNNYAYGWEVAKTDSLFRVGHIGGVPGFLSRIDRYPNKEILVVILSNNRRSSNPEIDGEFSELVLKTLFKSNYAKSY